MQGKPCRAILALVLAFLVLNVFVVMHAEVAFSLTEQISLSRMLSHLEIITQQPRPYGSPELLIVRDYLAANLAEMGYEVTIQEFGEGVLGYNVIATKRITDENAEPRILLVGAHYDSYVGSLGADDNGSGTVALLELAQLLKNVASPLEIRFLFFDGEEIGLLGSLHHADSLSEQELNRIVAMINLDMFAHRTSTSLRLSTLDGIHNYLVALMGPVPHYPSPGSDHATFAQLAIPAVSIHQMGSRLNTYHTPNDSIDIINTELLEEGTSIALQAIIALIGGAAPEPRLLNLGPDWNNIADAPDMSRRLAEFLGRSIN